MKYFDLSLAKEYSGSIAIIKTLCGNFIASYPSLKDVVLVASTEEFTGAIHSLKGISLNFGAKKIFDLICRFEDELSRREVSPNDKQEFLETCNQTILEIKQFLVE